MTVNASRRSIFGFVGGAALAVSAPAIARAAAPSEPWDQLIAALGVIDPVFAIQARDARDAGYHPDELHMVFKPVDGGDKFLLFRREFGPTPGPRTFPPAGGSV